MPVHNDADNTRSVLDSGRVTRETAEGIATVTFGHPKKNSLPGSLLRSLAGEITAAGEDPEARVILLRSEGTGPFCAGASFDEMVAIHDMETGAEFFSGFSRVILAMVRAPKPVVVRIQGKVVGGAVGMVSASDVAHATTACPARLSELAIGIGPFVIGPAVERRLGRASFGAMSADTEWRDPEWCERHGLYTRVHPDTETMDAALDELTRKLAGFNPDALRHLKTMVWAGTEGWEGLMAERARISGELVLSEFTRKAIEGFKKR